MIEYSLVNNYHICVLCSIDLLQATHWGCPDKQSLCDPSDDTCYVTVSRCIHETYKGHTLHCPGLEHLHHCDEYECPHMYKCTDTYCIPTRMLCDGNPDCPGGEDEDFCDDFQCAGLLHCRGDDICVHPTDICDGIIHCLLSVDDEDLCHMSLCPERCICRGSTVLCTRVEQIHDIPALATAVILTYGVISLKDSLRHLAAVLYLKISNCTFPRGIITPKIFHGISDILTLNLADNHIHSVIHNSFTSMRKLTYINLQDNHIHIINSFNFIGLISLASLNFYNFRITTLNSYSFYEMISLKKLNLSENSITALKHSTFYGLSSIETIDLRHNILLSMETLSFHSGWIHVILYFDDTLYCCFIGSAQYCNVDGHHHSHADHRCLAESNIVLIDIIDIVISLIVFVLNIIALLFQGTSQRSSSHVALLKHLVIASNIITIYLLLLCFARLLYKSEFIYLNTLWLTSSWCQLLSVIFFVGYFTPKCFWVLLVFDQFTAIRFIFQEYNCYISPVYIPGAVWLTTLLLAVGQQRIPLVNSVVCSPLLVSTDSSDVFQSTILLSVMTITALMIVGIIIMYYLIVERVKKSNSRVQSTLGNAHLKLLITKATFVISIQIIMWLSVSCASVYTYFLSGNHYNLRVMVSVIVHCSECLHIL